MSSGPGGTSPTDPGLPAGPSAPSDPAGAPAPPGSRWTASADVARGHDYDRRWHELEASGADIHGEASLVQDLAPGPRILDAGCGTGRVALELHRRGFDVTGVDLDPHMLEAARAKAPHLEWVEADLAAFRLDQRFHLTVLAGNVLIFVAPDTEHEVVASCAAHLESGGLLVAGFQVRRRGYQPHQLDEHAEAVGLSLVHRWSTWDQAPWDPDADYQVSVHRKD